MKILYCITRSNWGGAQAHLFDLISNQKKIGNEIILIVGEDGELAQRVKALGNIKIITLKSLQRNINLAKDINCIFTLREIFKQANPDIIHLHSSKAGALGRLAARGINAKVIYTAHGWAFTEGVSDKKRFVYIFIEKFLAKYTDWIICVSKYDYNLALKSRVIKKEKSSVIYNGSSRIKYNNKVGKRIRIVMTARFDVPKRQDLLIQAVKELDKEKYELILVGEGKSLKSNKNLAHKNSNVIFLGFRNDVLDILKESDIFVLISDYEGLPISIIEAMSASMAIVASNVGGIPELISNGSNGYLVSSNVREIQNTLELLINDVGLIRKLGQQSLIRYNESFSIEECLYKTNQLYERLSK